MRLHRLMELTLLAFVGSIAAVVSVASPAPSASGLSTWSAAHTESGSSAPSTTRRLRTIASVNDAIEEEEAGEERAGLASSTIEKAKALLSSKASPVSLPKWLKQGKSADSAFTHMRLDKGGEALLFSPKFTKWLEYVDDLNTKNPSKGTSAISTLNAHYGDAEVYKMIKLAKEASETKGIATRLQKEQMKPWITTAKSPDDVFKLMKVDKLGLNLLSDAEFTLWAKYVVDFSSKYPARSASMAPALVKSYGEANLFHMVEAAKSVAGTKDVATKLEGQLVKFWLNSRTSPDEALVKLELNTAVYSLLKDPVFASWTKYTNAFNAKYPREKSTVIETLTRKFGDEDVAMMLGKAKRSDATRAMATKLEAAQLEMWWSSGKSVDDLIVVLGLRLKKDFGSNPLLNTWVSYMNMYVKENPGKATAMLSSLETRYKDRAMNQILLEAMKFPSMESAATNLLTKKFKGYVASNESPTRVFEWLNLDRVGENLLVDPLFTKWLRYAEDFGVKNPNQKSVFKTIQTHYSNPDQVNRMIEVAMKNPSTEKIATLMQHERSTYWLDSKSHPRYVFRFLDLDRAGDNYAANPNFKIWTKYLDDFNKRYPKEKTTMADALRAQ